MNIVQPCVAGMLGADTLNLSVNGRQTTFAHQSLSENLAQLAGGRQTHVFRAR